MKFKKVFDLVDPDQLVSIVNGDNEIVYCGRAGSIQYSDFLRLKDRHVVKVGDYIESIYLTIFLQKVIEVQPK